MDSYSNSPPSRRSRFRSSGVPHRSSGSVGSTETAHPPGSEIESDAELEHNGLDSSELAAHEAEMAQAEFPIEDAIGDMEPPQATEETPEYLAATTNDPAPVADELSELPPAFRLTRSADEWTVRRKTFTLPAVGWTACVVFGFIVSAVIGYFIGLAQSHTNGRAEPNQAIPEATPAGLAALPAEGLKQVDDAFDATKQGHFDDARKAFDALAAKHPEWPSMVIESSRAALYAHDYESAGKTLAPLNRDKPVADAVFLLGLLHMTVQEPDKAEELFARAVAIDPARGDFFYFWGECLRREGKPQEAAARFRSAMLRNQYETAEGLYQLKLWLSEIQADQELKSGSAAKIDADLASPHPSWSAYFAAAARAIKVNKFKDAADFITRAQGQMDPAVFRVVLQDPTFLQESYRAELTPFYK